MKEQHNRAQKETIKWDIDIPNFRLVEGEKLVGGKCSKCNEEWPVGENLKRHDQFLSRFSTHSRANHPLDPNAHLMYLYAESKKGTGQPTQNTRYSSKGWQPSDL